MLRQLRARGLIGVLTPHDRIDFIEPRQQRRVDVAQIARDNGFAYVDLLPAFHGLTPEEIWAMPGDPHPNARGRAAMAEAIYPVLAQAMEADGTR
jgi:lysophospholipase L1-like esterase